MTIIRRGPKVEETMTAYELKHGASSLPYVPTPYKMVRVDNVKLDLGEIKGWSRTRPLGGLVANLIGYSKELRYTKKKALNTAIARYRSSLDSNNGFVETWVEKQASIDLATSVARSLNKTIRGIVNDARKVKRNPKAAKRILSKYSKRMQRYIRDSDDLKDIPSAYLAYNFGIAPTISTIHDTMTLLVQDFPPLHIKGRAQLYHSETDGDRKGQVRWHYYSGNVYALVQSTCKSVNPNVYLAQQLGLFTPSVLYELVPWSWFVDYFTNVGDVVANLDPSPPGLNLTEQFHVVHVKLNNVIFRQNETSIFHKGKKPDVLTAKYCSTERKLGIPRASLEVPTLDNLNLKRFALSMSALTLTFQDTSFLNKDIPGTRRKK